MIDTYKSIIEKINKLNEYSSEDFVKLSSSLINYNSKASNFVDETLFMHKAVKFEIPGEGKIISDQINQTSEIIKNYYNNICCNIESSKKEEERISANTKNIISFLEEINLDIVNLKTLLSGKTLKEAEA